MHAPVRPDELALWKSISSEKEADTIQTRAGASVDVSGQRWLLSASHSVNWKLYDGLDPIALDALKGFVGHLIRTSSAAHAANQFGYLRRLRESSVLEELSSSLRHEGRIGRTVFEAFRVASLNGVSLAQLPNYAGAFVRWYIWCTDAGYPAFDPDLASEFEQLKVGNNPQGQAVLRQDPESGPLREVELTALRSALKNAEAKELLTVSDLSLCWLFLSLGTNPRNILLLNEDDLIVTELTSGSQIFELRVPRIKKRTARDREQFRARRLVPQVGRLLQRLIAENRELGPIEGKRDRPLFRTAKARLGVVGTQFESQAYRRAPEWASTRLKVISRTLNLKSYTGELLTLYPRRLRYSFATRLVQEGASPQEVADALDHSSTQHVQVYFNARSDAVRRLDEKLSLVLAPVAQAFLGTLVGDERAAVRGDDPLSRVKHFDGTREAFEPVGTCGSFGFCGLSAPIACYTCLHFQAWVEAPHGEVLRGLEQRREKKLSEGADPKWIQIHDETMLAIAEVILRCGETDGGRSGNE